MRRAHQTATGEGTSVVEPRMLAYALLNQGPPVTIEETRLLEEEAYPTVTSG